MKKLTWFKVTIILLFTAITPLLAQNSLPPNIEQSVTDINAIHNFYPRLEGSANEQRLIQFILKRLDFLKVQYTLQDYSDSDLVHSFSKNIVINIPGKLKDTVILAVPLNHPREETRDFDGAVNIALALALIKQLHNNQPPVSVEVVFLGAEFGDGKDYPLGSRLFLKDFEPDFKTVIIYLELKKIPARLLIQGGGRGIVSPYWLINKCTNALKKTDIYFLVRGNENQIFRMGLTKKRTIIEPFLKSDYPALSFEGEYGKATEKAEKNFLFAFNLFFSTFLEEFKTGFPDSWDKHYLFFQAKNFYFIIKEKSYILIFLLIFMLATAYALAFPGRMRKYEVTIKRNAWTLPVIFIITFIILFISTLILEGITYLRKFPTIWEYLPMLFLLEKIVISLSLYAVLYNTLKKLPFSRNGSFYSASALLFFLIDTVILAVINISFTYYFLWAFFFALLFAVSPYRILKVLFFLASPYWIIKATTELFTLPSLNFCRIVLFSRIWGNLMLAVITVPFILLIIRLGLILPPARRRIKTGTNKIKRVRDIALFFGFLSVLFFVYLFGIFKPFNKNTQQPINAVDTINTLKNTNNLTITSPAPIGKIEYSTGDSSINLNTKSRKYITPLQDMPALAEFKSHSIAFLNRRNYTIDIQLKGVPSKLEAVISSDREFILYDSNFPFQRDKTGKSYKIFIGANPPRTLSLKLTLPQGFSFNTDFTIKYDNPPFPLYITGKNKKARTKLILLTQYSFKS